MSSDLSSTQSSFSSSGSLTWGAAWRAVCRAKSRRVPEFSLGWATSNDCRGGGSAFKALVTLSYGFSVRGWHSESKNLHKGGSRSRIFHGVQFFSSLRRNKTFLLCMYFYITLHCIGYSPSIPLSRHQGPTITYHPPLLGPIPLLRVPSSSYSLLLTASLYDPVSGSNRAISTV